MTGVYNKCSTLVSNLTWRLVRLTRLLGPSNRALMGLVCISTQCLSWWRGRFLTSSHFGRLCLRCWCHQGDFSLLLSLADLCFLSSVLSGVCSQVSCLYSILLLGGAYQASQDKASPPQMIILARTHMRTWLL